MYFVWAISQCLHSRVIFFCRECFFTTSAVHNKNRFVDMINESFGGGLTCSFTDTQLTEFYYYIKQDVEDSIPSRKGAMFIGHQPESDVWVITPDIHIDLNGSVLQDSEEGSPYVWLRHSMFSSLSAVSSKQLMPMINLPLSTQYLLQHMETLKSCLNHNFIPGLLTMGSVIMTFHYENIVELFDGCPIPFLYGPSGTGKTLSVRKGLSLVGMHKGAFFKKSCSEKWLRERSAKSTFPFTVDDPKKSRDVEEFIDDLYDQGMIGNQRTGLLSFRSIPIISANHQPSEPKYVHGC
jgi:hypothetical protein